MSAVAESIRVRPERIGFRDEAMSRRHRQYGFDVPATDIDFLLIEYDRCRACALIEYKHENAAPQHPSAPSYRILAGLGDAAGLPAFAVRYAERFDWFLVVALNPLALARVPGRQRMSEIEYVRFLYSLRGKACPDQVVAALNH